MGPTDVSPPTGERLDFLRGLGFDRVTHDSHVPFMSHLLGVRRLLVSWGERAAMGDAGLFHSVYGTEYFELESGADRDSVRRVIGDEAEGIAHAWCTIRRETFSIDTSTAGAPITVIDRHTGDRVVVSDQLAADIATLWAADTVEQIRRMTVEERAFARNLRSVIDLARPAAAAAVAEVQPLLDEVPATGAQD